MILFDLPNCRVVERLDGSRLREAGLLVKGENAAVDDGSGLNPEGGDAVHRHWLVPDRILDEQWIELRLRSDPVLRQLPLPAVPAMEFTHGQEH